MPRVSRVVLTCEHGGNQIPAAWKKVFRGRERVLGSHRGWDPGALELAKRLSRRVGAPLISSTTSRLLVDLNRSPENPSLFSEFVRDLPEDERERILAKHYRPYREQVEREVGEAVSAGETVLHLSVHSFTPVLRAVRRTADIGVLFDPERAGEAAFCEVWLRALAETPRSGGRTFIARANYPYHGRDDGLTTFLRARFPASKYLGVELEVNQRFPRESGPRWRALCVHVEATLIGTIGG